MGRRAKPAKAKGEAKLPVAPKSRKDDSSGVLDLEKRLAESLERERAKDRALAEALEQQTATSEILEVISRSPTDVQPVFDAVVRSGVSLCEADYGFLARYDGTSMAIVAHSGATAKEIEAVLRVYPMTPTPDSLGGRTILERAVVHIPDVRNDSTYGQRVIQDAGWRTGLGVPLLREGAAIGLVGMWRRDVRPFNERQIELLRTFANQAVIAIENVRLFNETKEALEHQTATSEILRVISQSPTAVQPVFDAIVRSALRLLDGVGANVARVVGEELHLAAFTTTTGEAGNSAISAVYPMPISGWNITARAVRARAPVYLADTETDAEYRARGRSLTLARGVRSLVAVPMMSQYSIVGTIAVSRREPGSFTPKEIALLQTFADQAVIAIENVRLFKELESRNRDLTATSEILQVISRSPTDVQPVFDTIAASARHLCGGDFCNVARYDGEFLHLVAHAETTSEGLEVLQQIFPTRPSRASVFGRTVLENAVVHIPDLSGDAEYAQALRQGLGGRSGLGVPMLREGRPIGAIAIGRNSSGPFTDAQISLLQTFADQAVIAIENVRLFKELQTSNRDLTTALEQQTATSELLKVIGRSTFDLQPVFETLAQNTVRLCEAQHALIFRFDGQILKAVAAYNIAPELRAFNALNPIAPSRGSCAGRVVLERRTVHIHDAQADPEYTYAARDVNPFRTLIGVPMLRAGELLGVMMIVRYEVRPFTDNQIALLETFADQAAIAIENSRLLSELRARTQDLTKSVGQLTALGEISHALSSTLDVDAVLDTIVTRANDLIGADGCTIFEYDEAAEQFHLRATRNLEPRLVELARGTPLRRGDQGILGRLPSERQPVQVPDITVGSYSSPISAALIEAGYRAVVAVPLIREEHLIGALTMNRKTPGAFPPETIQLLQTFATQSALAIQNARLFREIEDKSRQLEVASQHKSEFLANMSHELRTPLNAIIGFSEVLTDRMFGELNEKQDEYLKDIYASGTHLLSLINDILDLSKIEAGRMELEVTDFHLPTALDNALTLVRERAGRRNITLQMSVDERLGEVRADERKIRQVVLNLLSNAIKFTPEGGRIEVAAVPKDGFVEVSVSDTGAGIAPEDQDAIFEEFRQVGTADKKAEGTGLGLTLCRKFIELHGGRIWVTSQVGVGSTFTFTIPVCRGE